MDKQFEINEWYKDFKVKDSTTFAKDRAKELKVMTKVPVQLEGEANPIQRRVKVKSIDNPTLEWDEDHKEWFFNCICKVKVFD
jgi:hypothetical protein